MDGCGNGNSERKDRYFLMPSKLGIGIRWEKDGSKQSQQYIRSRILRGMPYGTMEYAAGVDPTILANPLINTCAIHVR